MKSAERKSVDQQQSLIAIQGLQTDTSHPEVARPGVLHPEIVNASSVCREMGRGSLQTLAHNYRCLPTGTKMAFTGVDGEVDIGIAVRCPYPFPVEAGSRGGFGKRLELCIVLDEIDQRLSLARLFSRAVRRPGRERSAYEYRRWYPARSFRRSRLPRLLRAQTRRSRKGFL
jgi:hypothetical protein